MQKRIDLYKKGPSQRGCHRSHEKSKKIGQVYTSWYGSNEDEYEGELEHDSQRFVKGCSFFENNEDDQRIQKQTQPITNMDMWFLVKKSVPKRRIFLLQ
jgi:hypothetical protein